MSVSLLYAQAKTAAAGHTSVDRPSQNNCASKGCRRAARSGEGRPANSATILDDDAVNCAICVETAFGSYHRDKVHVERLNLSVPRTAAFYVLSVLLQRDDSVDIYNSWPSTSKADQQDIRAWLIARIGQQICCRESASSNNATILIIMFTCAHMHA